MLRKKLKHIFLICFVCCSTLTYSQVQTSIQSITNQEFFNPAFGAFKENVTLSLFSRWQWTNFAYSPKIYALNANVPINYRRDNLFSLGATVISEDLIVRLNNYANISACKKLNISRYTQLSVGLGVGANVVNYNLSKMNITDQNFLLQATTTNNSFYANAGLYLSNRYYFIGVNTNLAINNKISESIKYPDIDLVFGGLIQVRNDILLKPSVVVKNYQSGMYREQVNYNGENVSMIAAKPLFNFALNIYISDFVWLATSHTLDRYQSFSIELPLVRNIIFGYSFEWGIGEGINSLSSNSVRMLLNFNKKGYKRKLLYEYN